MDMQLWFQNRSMLLGAWAVFSVTWLVVSMGTIIASGNGDRFLVAFRHDPPPLLDTSACSALLDNEAQELCKEIARTAKERQAINDQSELNWAISRMAVVLVPPALALLGLAAALVTAEERYRRQIMDQKRVMRAKAAQLSEAKLAMAAAKKQSRAGNKKLARELGIGKRKTNYGLRERIRD